MRILKTLAALIAVTGISVGAALATSATQAQTTAPPPPEQPWAEAEPWQANIYLGAAPEGSDDLPVLVFVHGMAGTAQHWWNESKPAGYNDSYDVTYEAGYRTAFVSLNPDGEAFPTRTNWANGWTLARQIDAIADHYGVDKVDVVAHSKGGVDTQTAAVYFGAASRIRNVFTLGAPHHGTPVVNLAFTSSGGKLIDGVIDFVVRLLGGRSLGMYTLSPQYMEWFRSVTDHRTEDDEINYYYTAGTDPGAGFSEWTTGRYLTNNFGPNDGLVTVESAWLPGENATELYVGSDNHFNMFIGENWFPCVDEVIREGAPGDLCAARD